MTVDSTSLHPDPPENAYYALYGEVLASAHPLRAQLDTAAGPPTVTFEIATTPPVPAEWRSLTPLYASAGDPKRASRPLSLFRTGTCHILRYEGIADYYLQSDRITAHLGSSEADPLVEILLLGPVFSFWLELRGVRVLHASACVLDGGAVGFLARSGTGKSTLAASLLAAGYPLLTDDLLPLEQPGTEVVARPGFPQMRLWPGEAEHFLGATGGRARVHPQATKLLASPLEGGNDRFHRSPAPLRRIYLPFRSAEAETAGPVEIEPLTAREAVLELVRHSFTPRLTLAAGLQAARLSFFAQVARQVPFRRLRYPSGLERLPQVHAAILVDLGRCE